MHEIALGEGQPLITNNFKYEWRLGGEQLVENDTNYERERNGGEVEDEIGNARPTASDGRGRGVGR